MHVQSLLPNGAKCEPPGCIQDGAFAGPSPPLWPLMGSMSRLPAQAGPFRPCRHHRFSSSVLCWVLGAAAGTRRGNVCASWGREEMRPAGDRSRPRPCGRVQCTVRPLLRALCGAGSSRRGGCGLRLGAGAGAAVPFARQGAM